MNDKNKYLVVIVALGLAIIGAMFYNVKSREVNIPKGQANGTGKSISQTEILVAVDTIPPGKSVTEQNFKWRNWPTDAVDNDYFTRSNRAKLTKLKGAIARQIIDAQEPLRTSDLYLKGDQNALAVLLEPNTVAVALPLKMVDNAHNLYHPGDIIDVILPKRVDNTHTEGNVILDSVKILAVDDRFDIPLSEKIEKMPQILILQLTRGQAKKLTSALLEGHLIISQHSATNDPTVPEENEKPLPSNPDNKITIMRGGQGSSGTLSVPSQSIGN